MLTIHHSFVLACHPALRLHFFATIPADAYENASDAYKNATTLFNYVFKEYEESMPPTATPQPAVFTPADSSDFLSTLAKKVNLSAHTPVVPKKTEAERWISGEGDECAPNYPLKWWKVVLVN